MSTTHAAHDGSSDESQPAPGGRGSANGRPEPQDGGLRGWCAVLATWTTWFLWGGLLKGLGVLLPTLKVQFVSKTWIIGWIIAMMMGSVGLSGVFAGVLGKQFGSGRVSIISGLMVSGGFIVASFTTSTVQLAVLLTLVAGPGLGFINILSREALGICFHKNYATASAISQTGLSVAMFVCAPLAQLFLDTYGWRGTMLLLGAMSMHLVVCGQLLRKAMAHQQRREYELVSTDENPLEEDTPRPSSKLTPCGRMARLCQGSSQIVLAAFKNLDCRLFCSLRFWSILAMALCTLFPFDMWYIYFISMAESKGFSPMDAALFVTYAGIGNIVLKVAHAPVVDRGIIGLRPMLACNIILCFATLTLLPWTNEYWSMAVSSCVYIGCIGVIANLYDVIVKVVLSKERMACAFGWIGIVMGIVRLLLGFSPGWIYDQTGSYDIAFLILGGLQPIGLIALGCLVYIERRGPADT